MVCDICSPKERGYTVYFAEKQNIDRLQQYFQSFSEDKWKSINTRMFWATEEILFDLMDYAAAHLDTEHIFAVSASPLDPLKELYAMKPINQLKELQETSWIDQVIQNRSLCTHYQPIVEFSGEDAKILGYELLSRGLDAQGNLIPPFKMFEAAKVRNRTFALDRACRMHCVENADKAGNKMVFINFIPTAIYVPEHCLSTTFKLIQKLNIKPEQVVFEVVETEEVKNIEHLISILEYYRAHGFKYALDDVGTGFNNLDMLSRLQPDYVKLAREYADGVTKDPEKEKVARAVLDSARQVGAIGLAEGIERKEDLVFLRNMGYSLFQGYYFGKPIEEPARELSFGSSAV